MKFQSSLCVSLVAALLLMGSAMAFAADDKDDKTPPRPTRPTFGTITDGTSNTLAAEENIDTPNNRTADPRDHRSERVVQDNETNFDEADSLFGTRTGLPPEPEPETTRRRASQQGRPQTDGDENEQEEIVAPSNRTRRVRDHRLRDQREEVIEDIEDTVAPAN